MDSLEKDASLRAPSGTDYLHGVSGVVEDQVPERFKEVAERNEEELATVTTTVRD
jgi:hypothetical protein